MKRISTLLLALALIFSVTACGGKSDTETGVPDDFSFSLVWGCYGDSSYDSKTGKLVKQKCATNVEDYTATYFLTDEQRAEIYALICKMNPSDYPDDYNPIKGEASCPSRNIILLVTYNGQSKTITCMNISLTDEAEGKKGKLFMAVHDRIVEILQSSQQWLSLPDYEFYFD